MKQSSIMRVRRVPNHFLGVSCLENQKIDWQRELLHYFGFANFRSEQFQTVLALEEKANVLALMPTGAGKSLCFLLPTLVQGGLTVVVSPLIALIQDQLQKAQRLPLQAFAMHSLMSGHERRAVLRRLQGQDSFDLLFLTPERFRQDDVMQALIMRGVRRLVIDEAHCISQWGHDFRPDYSKLKDVRHQLSRPQTLALTATATPEVQKEIVALLFDGDEDTRILSAGIVRDNLALNVLEVVGLEEKVRTIIALNYQVNGPTIIYFSLIQTLRQIADQLARLGQTFSVYHSQLPRRIRQDNQDQFLNGETSLMLATPAFGLGIDKANIRLLIHAEVPGSLESYYQEVGRAGRDGHPSSGYLLYDQDDLATQLDFLKWANPEPGFIQSVFNLLSTQRNQYLQDGNDHLRKHLHFYHSRDFRLETSLNLLERFGAITLNDQDRFEVVGELPQGLLDHESWQARLLSHQQRLHTFLLWIKGSETNCRMVTLARYFGFTEAKMCGKCDLCLNPLILPKEEPDHDF